ncbi:MAG: NADP-dependent oxidoreductase [Gammaproteobacteria bacterium]|nr:NADP-dependent oxidoreductase [Gammaproteobacteria bacterium]
MPQTADINRQWFVARYPNSDEAINDSLFNWSESPVPTPADNEFVVRSIYLAVGPALRGYLDKAHSEFLGNVPVGEVMRGRGIGEVVSSKNSEYAIGDIFVGSLGWQDYSVQQPRGKEFVFSTKHIREPLKPLSLELGILGQSGATAYFGLTEAGKIKAGDNVLISAAAGGVGTAAGQIARIKGAAKVIGIAGSDEKCAWLIKELGFDAAINYKNNDLDERLSSLFPDGIDLLFDSVGGEILNTALGHIAMQARVALCGFIATDYLPDANKGPINYRHLLYKRATMQGFIVFDYWERFAEAERALREWHLAGDLKLCEDVTDGLEHIPQAVEDLFEGNNLGVKICQVGAEK